MYEAYHIYMTALITVTITMAFCFTIFHFATKNKKQYDYYILKMYGLVDPLLLGPYNIIKDDIDVVVEALREDPEQSQNSFHVIKVTKGAEIDV
jgi:hypothetical protein